MTSLSCVLLLQFSVLEVEPKLWSRFGCIFVFLE